MFLDVFLGIFQVSFEESTTTALELDMVTTLIIGWLLEGLLGRGESCFVSTTASLSSLFPLLQFTVTSPMAIAFTVAILYRDPVIHNRLGHKLTILIDKMNFLQNIST